MVEAYERDGAVHQDLPGIVTAQYGKQGIVELRVQSQFIQILIISQWSHKNMVSCYTRVLCKLNHVLFTVLPLPSWCCPQCVVGNELRTKQVESPYSLQAIMLIL